MQVGTGYGGSQKGQVVACNAQFYPHANAACLFFAATVSTLFFRSAALPSHAAFLAVDRDSLLSSHTVNGTSSFLIRDVACLLVWLRTHHVSLSLSLPLPLSLSRVFIVYARMCIVCTCAYVGACVCAFAGVSMRRRYVEQL